jgi:hypothetical protein
MTKMQSVAGEPLGSRLVEAPQRASCTRVLKWAGPAAAIEAAATGLVLIITPLLFARLIFGATFSPAGQALGRLTGIALIGFALATWPAPMPANQPTSALRALLVYNLLATIYLGYLGLASSLTEIMFWPAVAMRAAFTVLLGHAWLASTSVMGAFGRD